MRKSVVVAAVLAGVVPASAALAEENRIYKYFTASYFSAAENLTSETPDLSRVKVCATPSWSIETSGHPDKLQDAHHVVMAGRELLGGAARQICDIAALPWHNPEWHAQILSDAKSMEMVEVKALAPAE